MRDIERQFESHHSSGVEPVPKGGSASATEPGPAASPLVELDSMTLRFSKQTILNKLSFEIPRGQTLVIVGESGCGKTMLLKSIVGLIQPTSGRVLVKGQDIAKLGDVEMTRLRRNFGFVFQNAALFDSMTVGQNVAFPLVQHNLASGSKLNRIVSDLLAEVGLPDHVAQKRPAELSGGMRKRVGLARALALSPELMLYDEPTTGLDPIMSDVINELMVRTSTKPNVTSVIITHDMRTARKVADRVIMLYPLARLKRGEPQIIYDGPPSGLESTDDRRVRQFVEGQAGERLMELGQQAHDGFEDTPELSNEYSP
jgi:phospholipid/cholesterol/gamma-HCH transport system ATP-binding protein